MPRCNRTQVTAGRDVNKQDRKFFDIFVIVIGALVAIALVLFALSRSLGVPLQTGWIKEDDRLRAQVEERIRPLGRVVTDPAALERPAEVMAPPAQVATAMTGPQVYNAACTACHSAGIAGAPRTGDVQQWIARIAQGMDILYQHSIEGFLGEEGYMPPKGGRTDLSDEEVMAAVDYMVEESS
jgi:cytochrome c5